MSTPREIGQDIIDQFQNFLDTYHPAEPPDIESDSSFSSISELSSQSESSEGSSSSWSSFSEISSESSGSSISSPSSKSSRSSGSSSSQSASSFSSGSSSQSGGGSIIPPEAFIARIGVGIDRTTLKTDLDVRNPILVRNSAELTQALQAARSQVSIDGIFVAKGNTVAFPANGLRGLVRPANRPLVITTDPLATGQATISNISENGSFEGVAFVNLEHIGKIVFRGAAKNVLFEDVKAWFDLMGAGTPLQGVQAPLENVVLRFCRILDHWALAPAMTHGIYTWNRKDFLMEWCVLDHNGWDPAATRATPTSAGGGNNHNHNAYFSRPGINDIIRWNVISRASSHGCHFRHGGSYLENLHILNPIGMQYGYGGDGEYGRYGQTIGGSCQRNVFVGSDDINTAGGTPLGIAIWLACCNNPMIFDNVAILNETTPVNDAVVRVERKYPISATLNNNKSYQWKGTIFEEPGTYPATLIQNGNQFEVPSYSETAFARTVMSRAYIDDLRVNGIRPAKLLADMERLRKGFP